MDPSPPRLSGNRWNHRGVEEEGIMSPDVSMLTEADGMDPSVQHNAESLFRTIQNMSLKLKYMKDKIEELETQTEEQQAELIAVRGGFCSEGTQAGDQQQALIAEWIGTAKGIATALDSRMAGGSATSARRDVGGWMKLSISSIARLEDTLQVALESGVDFSSVSAESGIVGRVEHLVAVADGHAREARLRRAEEEEGHCDDQTVSVSALQRFTDLLGCPPLHHRHRRGDEDEDDHPPGEALVEQISNHIVRLRSECESLRRLKNVQETALSEYDHEVKDVLARAGLGPRDSPNVNDVIRRLSKMAHMELDAESVLPPKATKGATRSSKGTTGTAAGSGPDSLQDHSYWVMALLERLQRLDSLLLAGPSGGSTGGGISSPLSHNTLTERYQNYVTGKGRSGAGDSRHDMMRQQQETAENIRSSVWAALGRMESHISDVVSAKSSAKQAGSAAINVPVERRTPPAAEDASTRVTSEMMAALVKHLPTSCKPAAGASDKEVYQAIKFALSMHNTLAATALLTPASVDKATKLLDTTCVFGAPLLDDEDCPFAPADWNFLLRSVGIRGPEETPLFQFRPSGSIPEAVDGTTARLAHFSDKFHMNQQRNEVLLQSKQESIQQCYSQISKLLLPQEYHHAQLSSENPTAQISELLLNVADRMHALEVASRKKQRTSDIAKGERSKLESAVHNVSNRLKRLVGASSQTPGSGTKGTPTERAPSPSSPPDESIEDFENLAKEVEKQMESLRSENQKANNTIQDFKVRQKNADANQSAAMKRMGKIATALKEVAELLSVQLAPLQEFQAQQSSEKEPSPPSLGAYAKALVESLHLVRERIEDSKGNEANVAGLLSELERQKELKYQANALLDSQTVALSAVQHQLATHRNSLKNIMAMLCSTSIKLSSTETSRERGEGDGEDDEELTLILRDLVSLNEVLKETVEGCNTSMQQSTRYFQSLYETVLDERAEVFDGNLMDTLHSMNLLGDTLLTLLRHEGVPQRLQSILVPLRAASPGRRRKALRRTEDRQNTSEVSATSQEETQYVVDHRLLRLHDTVARLATVLSSHLEVNFFAIRELAGQTRGRVEEADDDANTMFVVENIQPMNSPYSNDTLVKTLEHNMEYLERKLALFGSGFKYAAILIQRDFDRTLPHLVTMLESLQKTSVDELNLSASDIKNLEASLKRQIPSASCYFLGAKDPNFAPESHEAPWTSAISTLSYTYVRIVESLLSWVDETNNMQEQMSKVAKAVARMVANSEEEIILPSPTAQEGEEGEEGGESGSPDAITSENLLPILERLADSYRPRHSPTAEVASTGDGQGQQVGQRQQLRMEELKEELQLHRETLAVLKQRHEKEVSELETTIKELTIERDTSNSAAAIARALLRRQGQQLPDESATPAPGHHQHQQSSSARHSSPHQHSSSTGRHGSPTRRPTYEKPTLAAEEKHVYAWNKGQHHVDSRDSARRGRSGSPLKRQTSSQSNVHVTVSSLKQTGSGMEDSELVQRYARTLDRELGGKLPKKASRDVRPEGRATAGSASRRAPSPSQVAHSTRPKAGYAGATATSAARTTRSPRTSSAPRSRPSTHHGDGSSQSLCSANAVHLGHTPSPTTIRTHKTAQEKRVLDEGPKNTWIAVELDHSRRTSPHSSRVPSPSLTPQKEKLRRVTSSASTASSVSGAGGHITVIDPSGDSSKRRPARGTAATTGMSSRLLQPIAARPPPESKGASKGPLFGKSSSGVFRSVSGGGKGTGSQREAMGGHAVDEHTAEFLDDMVSGKR